VDPAPIEAHRALALTPVAGDSLPSTHRKVISMAHQTYLDKAAVVDVLRSRDLHGRADWVEREFGALIDTTRNASLLQTLGIDVATMSPRESASQAAAR
jgi:hypothetical protein